MLESKFQERLKTLSKRSCFIIKTHGHAMQSSIPDLLVSTRIGLFAVELKFLRKTSPTSQIDWHWSSQMQRLTLERMSAVGRVNSFLIAGFYDAEGDVRCIVLPATHRWVSHPPQWERVLTCSWPEMRPLDELINWSLNIFSK